MNYYSGTVFPELYSEEEKKKFESWYERKLFSAKRFLKSLG